MKYYRFKAIIFMFFSCFLLQNALFAQGNEKITINKKNITLQDALQEIEKQSTYLVAFNESKLEKTKRVDLNVNGESLDKALSAVLAGTGFTYKLKDKYIMIVPQSKTAAEKKKISGLVKDERGELLIGVNVSIKGSSTGTITNIDGEYTLQAAKGDVLEFSYVGYTPKFVTVGDVGVLAVVLQEDSKALDEVVVTALGIKRSEKALSYNVQKVTGDDLTTVKDANFINSLNGKVAGVNIQRSASGVGGGTRVVMRGNKSISGDNNVLYVVDGVPIGNQADRGGDGTGYGGKTSGEGISNFNSDDIESLSVLTGPSAAALYGASAANGVILINTKKGIAGKVRVNVSSSVEMMNPFVMPEFQNTYGNVSGDYNSWGDKMEKPTSYDPKDFFETGATYNNSFNLSTGNDKNQTYFSVSAINSSGIVPNNKYHRYNVMLRNTAKFFNDKLTFDASVNYIREYYSNMVSYGTYFNPIVGTYLYPRGENFEKEKYFEHNNTALGYSEQFWGPGDMGLDVQNPYWTAYRNVRPEAKDRYMLYASLKYDIASFLNVSGRVRLDNTYMEKEDKRYASTISTFAAPNGRYNYFNETFRQKYADVMANFDKTFAEKYRATVNAGVSFEEYDTKGRGYGGELLLAPNKFTYSNVDPTLSTATQTGGDSRKMNFAAFVSGEFSWNSALYLTLTGRADKPSQLVNSKDPWIFYPSVGLSAIVTELLPDAVKQQIKPVLSFLKVRGSFTEVGSPIPYTGLTPGTISHEIFGGKIMQYLFYPLSDLKAEKTRSYEVGIDSKWLNNTITLGVTYYHSNTYNQLLQAKLSEGAGYDYIFVQAGNVRNRGLEFNLGFDQKFGEFGYNTMFTATTNKNKIIKLASDVRNPVNQELLDLSDIQVGRFRLREGGEIGTIYANERLKRDQDNYVEYNPGGSLATETTDPYKLGSVNPDWTLGWRNGLSYKGFTLDFLITARLGGIVISKTQAMLDRYGVSKASALARDAGGIPVGNFTVDPKSYYAVVSNLDAYYVYSATNVRLQEASLTYAFPAKWFKGVVNNLSLSAYGTNLWMIYNKAPYDPELTASTGTFGQGYDYFMLPSQSTYGLSLKIGF